MLLKIKVIYIKLQICNFNFQNKLRYSQVLFMGSVPRINCPKATVMVLIMEITINQRNCTNEYSLWISINQRNCTNEYSLWISINQRNYTLLINNMIPVSKGVSILYSQLPYTLKLVISYPITSSSKAA